VTDTVKMDVIVRKDFPLFTGESVRDASKKLVAAGRDFLLKKLNLTEKSAGVYMVEAFSTAGVFEVYRRDTDAPCQFFAATFKRDDDGNFEFGTAQEVERVTSFQPKQGAATPTLKSGLPGWPEVTKSMWSGVI